MKNQSHPTSLWNISVRISPALQPLYKHIFESLCPSVSWDEDPQDGTILVEGIFVQEEIPPLTAQEIREKVEDFCASCDVIVPASLVIKEIPDRNWLKENQQSFPPQTIGKFFIYGSHYKGPFPPDLLSIQVDAALAFGSGEHATTQGCLRALSDLSSLTPHACLDMGCGSGILAIAMAKLFKAPVMAADIDPFSTNTTLENCAHNKVSEMVSTYLGDGYKVLSPDQKFDLITSNILAGPLCAMAPQLVHHLNPQGYAILAGLLENQADDVIKAHTDSGLRFIKSYVIEGWSILLLQK